MSDTPDSERSSSPEATSSGHLTPSSPMSPTKTPLRGAFAFKGLDHNEETFYGSTENLGETGKQRIPHHRVDDLQLLEDNFKIGKKLGQ
jgi:hypothetical protein